MALAWPQGSITVSKQMSRFTFQPALFLWQKDSAKFQSFPDSISAVSSALGGQPSSSTGELVADLKLPLLNNTVKYGFFKSFLASFSNMGEAIRTWLEGQSVFEDDPCLGAPAAKRNKLIIEVPIISLSWRLFRIRPLRRASLRNVSSSPHCWLSCVWLQSKILSGWSPSEQTGCTRRPLVLCIFKTVTSCWDTLNSLLLGQRDQSFKGMKELHFGKRLGAVSKDTAALPWILSMKRTCLPPNTFASALFPGEITSAGPCCFSHVPRAAAEAMQQGALAKCHCFTAYCTLYGDWRAKSQAGLYFRGTSALRERLETNGSPFPPALGVHEAGSYGSTIR